MIQIFSVVNANTIFIQSSKLLSITGFEYKNTTDEIHMIDYILAIAIY